ncbi:DUF2290 domain-containing protein [Sulfitobacter sp. 1A13679]|uniref:DUF2290 domain-containing protein n=1 Tax=Sulfitobacter sp. 1A13679 TaxID=3368597 RepID=UPI0037462FDA
MSDLKSISAEIRDLTSKMIEVGLCVEPNYPRILSSPSDDGAIDEISVNGLEEVSAALRNRPYVETYTVLREERAFNMRLIDGALVQFRYRFQKDELVKHVLAFYPSPDLLEYQNEPEIYETDVLYAEVVMKDIVTTPVRFDYDPSSFVEYLHPSSHFTIGQYKNCRVPVLGALTPFRFLNFILRAFYNTPFHEYCSEWRPDAADFPETMTARERSDLHWSFS